MKLSRKLNYDVQNLALKTSMLASSEPVNRDLFYMALRDVDDTVARIRKELYKLDETTT